MKQSDSPNQHVVNETTRLLSFEQEKDYRDYNLDPLHHYGGSSSSVGDVYGEHRSSNFHEHTASDGEDPCPSTSSNSFVVGFNYLRNIKNEQWHLILCVALLILFTAVERVTFKMTVDRMTPYRYFTVMVILSASALIYSIIVIIKRTTTNLITPSMYNFPHTRILSMAFIETVQFSILFISAAGVTPTMTLILLHANTITNVFLNKYVLYPNRSYTVWQMRGVWLITAAILISIARPFYHYIIEWHETEANCTLWYIFAACILGMSNLYKEHSIISWREPMDIHLLSSWLYIYQLLLSILAAPILYYFQNVSVQYTHTTVEELRSLIFNRTLPVTEHEYYKSAVGGTDDATGRNETGSATGSLWIDAYPLADIGTNIANGIQCMFYGRPPDLIYPDTGISGGTMADDDNYDDYYVSSRGGDDDQYMRPYEHHHGGTSGWGFGASILQPSGNVFVSVGSKVVGAIVQAMCAYANLFTGYWEGAGAGMSGSSSEGYAEGVDSSNAFSAASSSMYAVNEEFGTGLVGGNSTSIAQTYNGIGTYMRQLSPSGEVLDASNHSTAVQVVSVFSYEHDVLCLLCNCQGGLWLILLFILSNIVVSECIGQVLLNCSHVLDRSLAIAIFTAFIALGVYDTKVIDDADNADSYGGLLFGSIGIADFIGIVVLLVGIEIHGREDSAVPEENEDGVGVSTGSNNGLANPCLYFSNCLGLGAQATAGSSNGADGNNGGSDKSEHKNNSADSSTVSTTTYGSTMLQEEVELAPTSTIRHHTFELAPKPSSSAAASAGSSVGLASNNNLSAAVVGGAGAGAGGGGRVGSLSAANGGKSKRAQWS